jgi:excisionase family DNA binding protein
MANKQTATEYDWMNRHEVAELLDVQVWTIDRWAKLGSGPPFHQIGSLRKYNRPDVEAWIRERRVEGATP